jgi:uncharacterized membrane-anchored protein
MNPRIHAVAVAAALLAAIPAGAQAPASTAEQLFESIQWQEGPDTAHIGSESQITVPANCGFTDARGARTFMLATENPPAGNELGVLLCNGEGEDEHWFVVFSFDDSGYVRDTDAGDLDADAILASLREGTEAGNVERRSRGWGTISLDGWQRAPYYDTRTNNLTWATRLSDSTGVTVNHSVRLLGRGGVMHADLVVDPEQLAATMPSFDGVVATHSFLPGKRYSEWRQGDKMAEYGLAALIAGGAGAVAVKSGLLGKLIKVIVVAVAGAAAWLRSLFTGKKRDPNA